MNESQKSCRQRRGRTRRTPLVLIGGWLAAAAAGCATPGDRVEYIPADRAVAAIKKGEPAPADGWFVTPDVMQEMIPSLDERFRTRELAPEAQKYERSE